MSKLTQDSGVDKVTDPKEQIRFISQIFDAVKRLLNNGLGFSDNFDAKIVSASFTSASSDLAIAHGLGRVPSGYVPVKKSASMNVFDGSAAANSTTITLQSSAAGTASLLIF